MLLKSWFLLLYLFSNAKSESIYFNQPVSQYQTVTRDFKSSHRNATGVQKLDRLAKTSSSHVFKTSSR